MEVFMPNLIPMQSFVRSSIDQSRLCSFDQKVIEKKGAPIIHQEARILYIKNGKGCIKIQSKDYKLQPGCLVTLLPWQISQIVSIEKPLQYFIVVYNYDTLNQIIKTFYDAEKKPVTFCEHMQATPVVCFEGEECEEIEKIFYRIRNEVGMESTFQMERPKPLSTLATMNKLVELLIFYEREGQEHIPCFGKQDSEIDSTDILRYMYMHCNEKLTLQKLSQVFYSSKSTISNYITQITGLSFFDLLNEMRISKTANYLLYTDFTLKELAEIMGYVDDSHISKVFSARLGCRIGEYRNTYQKVHEICQIDESRIAYSVVNYIYRNYQQELTPKKVAKEFNTSVTKLNGMLVCQVEKNFEDFLNFIRVNRACELLLKTKKSVTDIAIEVGYNTTKTLTRNFLKQKVMTPSAFRTAVVLGENVLNKE